MRSFYRQKRSYEKKAVALPFFEQGKESAPRARNKKPQFYLIVFILFYFSLLFFTQFVRHVQVNSELNKVKNHLQQVNEQNAIFKEEIELLYDLEYLEELARGRLGMARPGEMLFHISEITEEGN